MRCRPIVFVILASVAPAPVAAQWFVEVGPRSSRALRELDRSCTELPDYPRVGAGRCDPDRLGDAIVHHRRAQGRRAGRPTRLDREAIGDRYRQTARIYREYVAACEPPDEMVYPIYYNIADALFWSEQYAQAARVFRRVRDWPGQRGYEDIAAARTITSLERALEEAIGAGSLVLPPIDLAAPPRAPPPLVAALIHAREVYVARIPRASYHADPTRMQSDNALLLARYGYLELARARMRRAHVERCLAAGMHMYHWDEAAWAELSAAAAAIGEADLAARVADTTRRCAHP